jgi:hypothetical protein
MEPRIAFLDNQHFIPGVTCHLKAAFLALAESVFERFFSLKS